MSGWDKSKVSNFKGALAEYLRHIRIDSKDTGGSSELNLFLAQKRFLSGIFSGLEDDVHDFTILKSRQLGISTISWALDLFWVGVHSGLKGAVIFDTDGNKEDARQQLVRFLESFPPGFDFPKIIRHYRGGIVLDNGSSLGYLVAGIKKSRGTGGLGRSRGLSFIHATECSSWADEEGLRSLQESLSDIFENRLYIWESTARGFNIFHDMWENAKIDTLTKRAIFIGWWAKDTQKFDRGTALFERYGTAPANEEEAKRINLVKELYGYQITQEQLAWIRHKESPRMDGEFRPDEMEMVGQIDILQQEQPWTEHEAFLLSGANFFPSERLTDLAKSSLESKYRGYRYFMTEEFTSTVLETVKSAKIATLKIWEEPDPQGVYVIGADPAYGSDDTADRYVCQVLRCYADGLDQVAEFCNVVMTTEQFAWVIAHLCGAYANARLLLEMNGPGNAVWNAFKTLKLLLQQGYLHEVAERQGLVNILDNVKSYMWHRDDSLSQNPTAFHWETNTKRKVQIFERLKDFVQHKQLNIRSMETISEMKHIIRNGDSIHGEGSKKDDRVMALAMAVHAWERHERNRMIQQQRTRENEAKRRDLTSQDLQQIFSKSLFEDFFARKSYDRVRQRRAARRGGRWDF